MGVLSDPSIKKRFVAALERWRISLSFVSFFGGLIWLGLLASEDFNSRTYFSENALLPATVDRRYAEEHVAGRYYETLKEICRNRSTIAMDWLANELCSAGLEVFHQNFKCDDLGPDMKNIFGILRSPRSSGVESLVLNVPFRGCNSNGGLALMFSLVEYFKIQNYWAKDIIFLITHGESCGVTSWLASYHGVKHEGILASDLQGHAGKIQGALVIDLEKDMVNGFDVLYEGVNGLEPNLDLISTAFAVSRAEGIPTKLHNEEVYHGYVDRTTDYFRCFKTLLKGVLQLASGIPSGGHGHYIEYRIEAITLKNDAKGQDGTNVHFNELGRAIEGIFRSLNNLQEHFHQSFFMYLLPASYRYVSIAYYMPVVGGILIGPLLQSVKLWINLMDDSQCESKERLRQEVFLGLFSCACFWMESSIIALCFTYGYSTRGKTRSIVDPDWSGLLLLLPLAILLVCRSINNWSSQVQWRTAKLFTLLILTTLIALTSLLNFSFALILAVVTVPAALLVNPESSRWMKFVSLIAVLLACPITLLGIWSLCNVLTYSYADFAMIPLAITEETSRILDILYHYRKMGVWTWDLVAFAVLPIWFFIVRLSN